MMKQFIQITEPIGDGKTRRKSIAVDTVQYILDGSKSRWIGLSEEHFDETECLETYDELMTQLGLSPITKKECE